VNCSRQNGQKDRGEEGSGAGDDCQQEYEWLGRLLLMVLMAEGAAAKIRSTWAGNQQGRGLSVKSVPGGPGRWAGCG